MNRRLSNKENRLIARGDIPGGIYYQNNPQWSRVINPFQLPEILTDEQLYDACFVTHQQLYQLRDDYVYPFLNLRAAAGGNAGNANAGLPHALTPDSLTAMVMVKIHHDVPYRLLSIMFGIHKSQAQTWVKAVRNHIFNTDPVLIRNRNLSNPANLVDLLETAHQATINCPRTNAIFSHLALPRTRIALMAMDSKATKAMKSSDSHLQYRSMSSKIKANSLQKMTISSVDGMPLITFPLMVSISPAGTDESNMEALITIEESGFPGGLATILRAITPANGPQYTVIFLGDSGFYKWGFDRQIRRSFVDYMDNIRLQTNGRVKLFLPCLPSGSYVDNNLNVAGSYAPHTAGGNRHRARTASTSCVTVTKTRWCVEATFAKEYALQISGSRSMVPQQYLE